MGYEAPDGQKSEIILKIITMTKRNYVVPEIMELEMHAEGMLASSTFGLSDYKSNGEAIELEF